MQDPEASNSGGTRGNAAQRERMSLLVRPAIAGLLLLITLLGLVGTAIRDPRPHDIAVGLVGPSPAVQQISSAFAANAPGAFEFTSYGSEAEARAALDSRTIDGALVLGGSTPVLIVAGAAGDATTGVITAAFTNVFKAQGGTINVEVVHPFAAGDAHGLILFFVVVAVIISTMVAQALLFVVASGAGFVARLTVVLVYAVLAGLVGMGMATWIAGDYGSGFWTAAVLVMQAPHAFSESRVSVSLRLSWCCSTWCRPEAPLAASSCLTSIDGWRHGCRLGLCTRACATPSTSTVLRSSDRLPSWPAGSSAASC